MATVTFTNNRNFDLHLCVYDLNGAPNLVCNNTLASGGSWPVQVQGAGNTVHYHWSVMETRNDENPAFHGAHFEHNEEPVIFSNPHPPLVQLPSMFRPFP